MSPDDAPVRPKVRARAFIVEDEWTIAQGLQLVLEDMGLQVEHLLRRYQDLEPLLAERPPDLILMDIALVDEVDGIQIAQRLLPDYDIPLIFVSGQTDPQTMARLREVGASGFVVKPFTRRQLEAAVEVALAKPPHRRQPQSPAPDKAQAALGEIAKVLSSYGIAPSQTAIDWRKIATLSDLSPREAQVLDALIAHRRPPQIAEDLGISPHTVRNHLKSIYAKCGVSSQSELLNLITSSR